MADDRNRIERAEQLTPDRRQRNVEQTGYTSQPTPVQPRVLTELEDDAIYTAKHLMKSMRENSDDPLNGGERLHALADALNSVTAALCVARTEELELSEERTYER